MRRPERALAARVPELSAMLTVSPPAPVVTVPPLMTSTPALLLLPGLKQPTARLFRAPVVVVEVVRVAPALTCTPPVPVAGSPMAMAVPRT